MNSKKSTDSRGDEVVHVDPMANRPPNWDEAAPETLVPETARATPVDRERDRRIAERAYELACERGMAPGQEVDDWLRAEQEVDAASRRQTPPEDQFTG